LTHLDGGGGGLRVDLASELDRALNDALDHFLVGARDPDSDLAAPSLVDRVAAPCA
jgi:hypothetical protein